MRLTTRSLVIVSLLMLAPVLAGCADFDMDKLDVFGLNEKKKLPGDRRPLFPEGVPGVTQGIPPEYMKGAQQQPDPPSVMPAAPEQKAAAVEPQPKPKAKPKPKPKAASAPTQVTVQPAQQQPQQQPRGAQAPWPEPAPSGSTAPWPSAPAPGTFSR